MSPFVKTQSTQSSEMFPLLHALTQYFERWIAINAVGSNRLALVVNQLRRQHEAVPIRPKSAPVTETWLNTSLQLPTDPSCQPLLDMLIEMHTGLNWKAATDNYVDDKFADGFAYTQLVGRAHDVVDGVPFLSDTVIAGFSLQAPSLFYPPHHHKALEFYGVLTGTAAWQAGGNRPKSQPPGAHIFHDSNIGHSMRTSAEPLLTAWAWVGDLDAPIHFSPR